MSAKYVIHAALSGVVYLLVSYSPAHADCTCPAGYVPSLGEICVKLTDPSQTVPCGGKLSPREYFHQRLRYNQTKYWDLRFRIGEWGNYVIDQISRDETRSQYGADPNAV